MKTEQISIRATQSIKTWKVLHCDQDDLETILNKFSIDGFSVHQIFHAGFDIRASKPNPRYTVVAFTSGY